MTRSVKLRKSATLPGIARRGQIRLYAKPDETLETIDDEGNRVPLAGGEGGGAVDSVNGATGVVVLAAEDVGAAADDDARLSDARTPTAHGASHESGGADEIDVTGLTGAGGAGAILTATVNLSAADIATLSSVPVQVIAAPGAGKVIVVAGAIFQYKAGAVEFDTPAVLDLAWDGVAATGWTTGTSGVPFNGLDDNVTTFVANSAAGATASQANAENQPLVVEADVEPDGAGDGTARLTVLYWVMDLA